MHFIVSLSVYAAASLVDVMPKIQAEWKAQGHTEELKFQFDASSRLARQIQKGAPADIFLSADQEWTDELCSIKVVDCETRKAFIRNRLVLISNDKQDETLSFVGLLREAKKIAVAGENVPAGRYADQVFIKSGLQEAVEDKLVRGKNVRTVLNWVIDGHLPLGIVYQSDSLAYAKKLELIYQIPEEWHPDMTFVGAKVAKSRARDQSQEFLHFLLQPKVQNIFVQAGFEAK